MRTVLICLALLCACVSAFQGLSTSYSRLARSSAKMNQLKMAEETPEELRERLRKKLRRGFYNEKGVAYAPWIANQIDEEAILEEMIQKELGAKKGSKGPTSVLDRGEVETSEGMKWRMSGNQVDLAWTTGGETDNKGFIVEKRPSYGGDFQEIASFQEVAQLVSKGERGGRYRYTDPSTASGSWIYRVRDCDSNGNKGVLCQCFVEVQSESESKSQGALAVGLVGFFVAAGALGFALDPPQ